MKPAPEICPTCGSPIVPPVPDLTPIKQRILDVVKRRPGISAEELRSLVWERPFRRLGMPAHHFRSHLAAQSLTR
jgi:hypothetical protein